MSALSGKNSAITCIIILHIANIKLSLRPCKLLESYQGVW